MSRVAIVGCGVVGSSWAPVFLRAGFKVVLFDAVPAARETAATFVRTALGDSSAQDAAGSEPLGLRWVFMGPFETIDLNAPSGIAEYCRNLGSMYHGLAQEQADPRAWSAALVGAVEAERRRVTPAEGLAVRRSWRDRCLAALVAAKRRVLSEASTTASEGDA